MAKTKPITDTKGRFDLAEFKKHKFSSQSVKFKSQEWIKLSPAFQEATNLPGVPKGHITLLRGHSDTGKTTALLECAAQCQRDGVLPVFIITEMKWNWEHAMEMGLQVNGVTNEDGEIIDYDGFFIFTDRSSLNTVEDIAELINGLLKDQYEGKLPYDLCFLWDSVGSIPCAMSVEKLKNNNEWNAGAMSTQFGNGVNQKIMLSRKEHMPYTNTLVAVNKVWVDKAAPGPMSQPKMMNKGGTTMHFDCSVMITFGNIKNSGVSKLKATKDKKQIEWGKRTKVQVEKNHVTSLATKGQLIMTPYGFIGNEDKDIKQYKSEHSTEWATLLGGKDFKMEEEEVTDSNIETSDNE